MTESGSETVVLSGDMLEQYRRKLRLDEYSQATIEKYMRDIKAFLQFLPEPGSVTKETVIRYKEELSRTYAVSSANSMLVAVNRFLKSVGAGDCCVKLLRIQRNAFCEGEKELTREEYFRLLRAARQKGNERLNMMMQTICSTGIRVSELRHIDVEAVRRQRARVSCKGKLRTIFLPPQLCRELERYCKVRKIASGPIFITRTGRPVDRSNIWTAMKHLCDSAKVMPGKVYPHNLRHLFARTFYNLEKDIVRLADLLGHASMETTRIYTVCSGRDHNRELSRMDLCLSDVCTT